MYLLIPYQKWLIFRGVTVPTWQGQVQAWAVCIRSRADPDFRSNPANHQSELKQAQTKKKANGRRSKHLDSSIEDLILLEGHQWPTQ